MKLHLLRQKFLKTGFVLEGTVELRPVVGQGLLLTDDFPLLVLGFTVKPTIVICRTLPSTPKAR